MQNWKVIVEDDQNYAVTLYLEAENQKQAMTEAFKQAQFNVQAIVDVQQYTEE